MDQTLFVKNSVIEELAFLVNSIENAQKVVDNFFNTDTVPKAALYTLINRQAYFKDFLESVNSNEYKLYQISGFQGTGKSELVKTLLYTTEEKCLSFYYECSGISHLDDIILALYQYLHKILSKDHEYDRLIRGLKHKSVDKRLLRYLKSLRRPLLIVIDGYENLIKEDQTIAEKELLQFLNYLLTLPTVKLILCGKQVTVSEFNISEENIYKLRLSGLDESETLRIFNDNKIQGSENLLYQAFEVTRGYPESILLFKTGVNILKLSPFDLIKDYSIRQESFEEYISKKIYNAVPMTIKKNLWILSAIRHPMMDEAINKFNFSKNIDKSLDYLSSNMLLSINSDSYYIKDLFRSIIYNSIPANEKIKIHHFLANIYSDQASCKLNDRIFQLSRKTLHLEHHHHSQILEKLQKDNNLTDQHYISELPLVSSYIASKFDFNKLASHIEDEVIQEEPAGEVTVKLPEDSETAAISSKPVKIELPEIESEFKIELSEEEKSLLFTEGQEETTENSPEQVSEGTEKPEEKKPIKTPEQIRDFYLKNAVISRKKGHMELALNYYQKALELSENIQDLVSEAKIAKTIANILESLKKVDESINYLQKSLNSYSILDDIPNTHQILLKIADIYRNNYKHDDALQLYHKIIKHPRENTSDKTFTKALTGIGDVYDYREELDVALRYYFEALDLAKNTNSIEDLTVMYFKIALIYDDMNNFDQAIEYYQNSIKIADNEKLNTYLSSCYANIASIYEELNNTNKAIINYTKALEIDRNTNNYEGQYRSLSRLAGIYSELDVKDKALGYLQEEIQSAKLTKDPYSLAMAYIDIGDFYLKAKNYENALKSFIKARKSVGKTISTDSKEKIDRRFKQIISEIGEIKFNILLENIKRKYG